MKPYLHLFSVFLLAVAFLLLTVHSEDDISEAEEKVLEEEKRKLSEYILDIIEHYKQKDPVGLPGTPIPEPLQIPPLKHSFSVATMNFKDVELYNLSQFRIDYIESDLAAMQLKAGLRIDELNVKGNYTLSSWFSRSQGPFTVKLSDVYVEGVAKLEVERDGQLQAQEMKMDITFQNIAMNFERLGFAGSLFQNIINSVGTFLFDSIKPFILSEINNNVRGDVNKKISQMPQRFPNSISPFDQMVAEGRKLFRARGFDPLRVQDYNHTVGLVSVFMTHTWVTGLASFYRVGNITFEIRNHTFYAGVDIGTHELEGSAQWELSVVGMMSRAGIVKFTIDYFHAEIKLSQTLDIRNKPKIDDIQLELGNIQMRCDGAGTLDYLIEFGVNVFPNLLRYQIMDALESPVRSYLQDQLNMYNLEEELHHNLQAIDNAQDKEFQM